MTGNWDRRGTGSREFTPEDYAAAVAAVQHLTIPRRYEDLSTALGIPGRTLRAILSEADGVEFVLVTGDDGVAVAQYHEDASHGSGRMRSQALRMLERVARREAWADAHLVKMQPGLW